MPVSVRELVLLAVLVIAGVAWFNEYEQSRKATRELQALQQKLTAFSRMLEAEAQLRENPKQGPVRLSLTEFGQPSLKWTMELSVLGDGQPDSPAAGESAAPPEAK